MNRVLKTVVASLLLGSATLAVAQSPAESFADQYRQFQSNFVAGSRIPSRADLQHHAAWPAPTTVDRAVSGAVVGCPDMAAERHEYDHVRAGAGRHEPGGSPDAW